jgi:hypothetical protein
VVVKAVAGLVIVVRTVVDKKTVVSSVELEV